MKTLRQKVLEQRSRRIAELLAGADHSRTLATAIAAAGWDQEAVDAIHHRALEADQAAAAIAAKGDTL